MRRPAHKTSAPERDFYSPAQVAELLGVTPAHVRRLIAEGALVAANIAAPRTRRPLWVVPRSEIVAMLEARGLKALTGGASNALHATDAHTVALARAVAVED